MAKKEEYESQTEAILQPIVDKMNIELVDVEYVKEGSDYYLRAYIDKEGGITIDDCEAVSRKLSDLLDEKDFIPEAYILEVSSPGLGRQLKKEKDYKRSIGKEVDIKLYKAKDGQKEFSGVLKGYDSEGFIVSIEEKEEHFKYEEVSRISLAFDF